MANLQSEEQIIGANRRRQTKCRNHPQIGDGVARIEGLSDAMLNEMIDLDTVLPASR
jgi:F0F1-type ATP synthase alpha subunit